jgi:hypothetical protein
VQNKSSPVFGDNQTLWLFGFPMNPSIDSKAVLIRQRD